jgi:hypothetical protein
MIKACAKGCLKEIAFMILPSGLGGMKRKKKKAEELATE